MTDIQLLLFLPLTAGVLLFLIPESVRIIKGIIALLVSAVALYASYNVFLEHSGLRFYSCRLLPGLEEYLILNLDNLSRMIILFIGVFGFLLAIYSLAYMTRDKQLKNYYNYFLITLGAAVGAVLANNFVTFTTFWGILGITLYKLISGNDEESSAAAKKSLIMIGASDSILILGIGIIWKLSGTLQMSEISIPSSGWLGIIGFLCLVIASLTKAGAFPVHTWLPDYVAKAPASSSALLPASLDKLLGIYFLARICLNLFQLTEAMTLVLLIIGGITILGAVMMALIQHSYKRLLGYHAVSQVGYMVTGIALGSPLGLIAGLFHMLNNAIYKSGLFLTAGSVEKRTGKEDLDELGGLSKLMPLTFISALIFALSISGIPPFNGFASKWMIYQGLIDFGKGSGIAHQLWFIWLTLAVLGSALTLASFVKFISGIFLGSSNKKLVNVREVSILMWLPQIFLALLCIGFGVFAARLVIPTLFAPITGEFNYPGIWNSQAVSILILVSIVLGVIIYLIGNIRNFRSEESFLGGEISHDKSNYNPLEFYKTIGEFPLLAFIYRKAEHKWFDIYDLGKRFVLWLNGIFSFAHSGILSTYITWLIMGMIILLIILI